jgi:hypothetical protein
MDKQVPAHLSQDVLELWQELHASFSTLPALVTSSGAPDDTSQLSYTKHMQQALLQALIGSQDPPAGTLISLHMREYAKLVENLSISFSPANLHHMQFSYNFTVLSNLTMFQLRFLLNISINCLSCMQACKSKVEHALADMVLLCRGCEETAGACTAPSTYALLRVHTG